MVPRNQLLVRRLWRGLRAFAKTVFAELAHSGSSASVRGDVALSKDSHAVSEEHRRRVLYEERRRQDEERRKEEREREEAEVERLLLTHRDLVDKFLQITERKVSVLDDYGDETWGILPKQIVECVCKIGEREGIKSKDVREWYKRGYTSYDKRHFLAIGERLESRFRQYHHEHVNG